MQADPASLKRLQKWSYWTVIAILLLLPVVIFIASGIKMGSASAHAWLPEGRPERARYQRFVDEFGSDQFLVASWDGCDFQDARVDLFQKAIREINSESSPIILETQSGSDVARTLMASPLELSEAAARARLQGSMFGVDGTTAVFIRFTPFGIHHQKDAIELLRRAADSVPGLSRDSLRMVGSIYEAYAVDEAAEQSLKRLVVPSSLLGIVLAWLCLRSVRGAAAVLIIAGVGQLIAIALVTATGGEFSAVLIVLPTLVFMLTLSAAVHFMNYYGDVAVFHREYLGARAILLGIRPSVLATITTALGMISLAASQLSPVRIFGLYSAAALCIATAILILAFPTIADWFCRAQFLARNQGLVESPFDADAPYESPPVARWAIRYAAWVQRYCFTIVFIGMVLIGVSLYGLLHLKSSTKFNDMFSTKSRTVVDMGWMESHLGPIASVEVLVRFPRSLRDNVEEPSDYTQLEWIDRLTRHLKLASDVGGVLSATTFLPKLPEGTSVRDVAKRSVFRKELTKSFPMLKDRGLLAMGSEGNTWRITVRISALSKLNYGELTSEVDSTLQEFVRSQSDNDNVAVSTHGSGQAISPFQYELTGLAPIMHDTQLALLDDLGASFSTAFLLITPVMMLIARGIRPGLLIMIPNVLPETLVFGTMAWLGYSIDIAGILTASVAMGIAVNDTLHFVNWYSNRLAMGDSRQQAIADTFSNCAKAMVHTMLISCCSMVPFMFAEFNPTKQFAMLMIAMMSTSILGDLFLLPALLLSPLGKTRDELKMAARSA